MSDSINGGLARPDFNQRRRQALESRVQRVADSEAKILGSGEAAGVVPCGRCRVANSVQRRFCQACGGVLWKNCPKCKNACPVADSFCGSCGEDLAAAEQTLVKESEERLAEIEEMVRCHELHKAMQSLYALTNEQTHPCLETTHARAKELIKQVAAERDRLGEQAALALEHARQLCENKDYERAVEKLEQISDPFRDDQVRSLLVDAREMSQRIQGLKNRLKKQEGVTDLQQLRTIDQLLTLCPPDAGLMRAAVQLRDHVMTVVVRAIREHRYRPALALLEAIPAQVVNKVVKKTRRHLAELVFLASELELAPEVTAFTIEAGRRLVRLDPKNQRAKLLVAKMIQRSAAAKSKSLIGPVRWAACPKETALGAPVDVAPMPSRTGFASPELKHAFALHPGGYYTACGLALQGLGMAAIATNLKLADRRGRIASFYHAICQQKSRYAWGVAVGETGLAAVRLAVDHEDQTVVDHCQFVPHEKVLTHPKMKKCRLSAIGRTLSKFRNQGAIDASDAIVAHVPTTQLLARFLTVPNVHKDKLDGLIAFEAQHQIPVPLHDLSLASHVFSPPEGSTGIGQCAVLLLAMRKEPAKQYQAVFEESGINVRVWQCGAVALYNWIHHELFAKEAASQGPAGARGVSVLDLGRDSVGTLLCGPNHLWFQTNRLTVGDLTNALTKRFQLTHDIANQWLFNPSMATSMSALHEQRCVVFRDLADRYEKAVAESANAIRERPIERVIVTGECGHLPGLLRFLRFGK